MAEQCTLLTLKEHYVVLEEVQRQNFNTYKINSDILIYFFYKLFSEDNKKLPRTLCRARKGGRVRHKQSKTVLIKRSV